MTAKPPIQVPLINERGMVNREWALFFNLIPFSSEQTISAVDLGTQADGTLSPSIVNGQFQFVVNEGDFTLSAPSLGEGIIYLELTNGSSAGTVDTSDFDAVLGDPLTTTADEGFLLTMSSIGYWRVLIIEAFQ